MRRWLALSVGGRSGRVRGADRRRQVKGHGEKLSRKAEQATVALLTRPGFAKLHWAARRRAVERAIASLQQTAGEAVQALRCNLASGALSVVVRAALGVLQRAGGTTDLNGP